MGGSGINGAAAGLNEDFNNRALHLDQLNRIKTIARGNAEKEQQLAAVLCVLQECSNDGIEGVTASSNYGLQKQGEELRNTNPELFDRLVAYIKNDSQLLQGDNAYGWKAEAADSFGKRVAKAQFAKVVGGALSDEMFDGVAMVANRLSDSLMDFVNIGKAVARNGPYSVSPLDMPARDDGRPPTAGGGTAVVTPPVVLICTPGVACLVPPVGGVVPSNVVLSTSGGGSDGGRGTDGVTESGGQISTASGGHSPITDREKEIAQLFKYDDPRRGIQIGDRTVLQEPNTGKAKIFAGVSEVEVKEYFSQLTGKPLPDPVPVTIRGQGGLLYSIETPQGNFVLRDVSASSAETGSVWTSEIPRGLAHPKARMEIKFLRK